MQRGMVIDGAGGEVLDSPQVPQSGQSGQLAQSPQSVRSPWVGVPWSGRGVFGLVWRPGVRKYLAEAREELDDLEAFAAEVDSPPPSPIAKALATELVEKVIRALPRYYSISPGMDGDVSIQAGGAQGYGVGVICRADGGASMYVVHPQSCIYECHYRPPATISAEEIVAAVKTLKPQ